MLSIVLLLGMSSCEKSDDDVSLKDFYRCEANINYISHDTWEQEVIEEVMILSLEFIAEDQFTISKMMSLNYGDYYFPDEDKLFDYDILTDSVVVIKEPYRPGMTQGVFLENKKYFNFSYFNYKLASDPKYGSPIFEPIEEYFYCEKNY